MTDNHHLYLVGLGLIGGSVAGGLKETPYRVTGWDTNPQTRNEAKERNLVSELAPPEELPESVTGVVLAIPVPGMTDVAKQILVSSSSPSYITDVGSTKRKICEEMMDILPDGIPFVGAHPMAGSEESGLQASDPILFENAICVITPCESDQRHVLDVIQIWESLGAHVLQMSPSQHDRSVAYVSHLPHLNASGLLHGVLSVDDHEETILPLAAGGFRDTTRVAEGDPDLWRDIFQTNKNEISEAIDNFTESLRHARQLIQTENWSELTEWLESARETRDFIPEKTKGLLGTLFELKLLAPDKPGMLAQITNTLADCSINISDIEVLRVREGERGSIKLGFRRKSELEDARDVLSDISEEIEII